MNLPVVNNFNVAEQLNRDGIVIETAAQIMKDFAMFGIEITFSGEVSTAYHELHSQLVNQVSVLVQNNYDLLLSVLYQIDITEKEMIKAQMELPHYNQIELLAHQIIARDLKKVLFRKYFSSGNRI